MAHWKDYYVQVRVNLGDGKCGLSTGYPVGPKQVLTSWHGLVINNTAPETRNISIHWFHLRAGTKERTRVEDIPWHCEVMDATLLEVEMPDAPVVYSALSALPAEPVGIWESRGYAAIGRMEYPEQPTELKGSCFSTGSVDTDMVLESIAVTHPDGSRDVNLDWRGISGAAVFQNGKIVGMLKSVDQAFDGQRLTATTSAALLNTQGFVSCYERLRDDAGELAGERMKKRERRLHNILENSDALRAAIYKRLADRKLEPAGASAEAVVHSLLAQIPEHEATSAVVYVHSAFADAGDQQAAAKALELLNEIIPAIFGPYGVQKILRRLEQSSGALVSLPVGESSIVEAVMAAADDRTIRYRMHGGTEMVGSYQLPDAPESGMGSDVSNQLLSDLGNQFCAELSVRLESKLLSKLRGDLDGDSATKNEIIRREIENHLSDESADRRTHYYVVPASPDGADKLSSQLVEVERMFPSLICIRLTADNNTRAAHHRAVRPLKRLHDNQD